MSTPAPIPWPGNSGAGLNNRRKNTLNAIPNNQLLNLVFSSQPNNDQQIELSRPQPSKPAAKKSSKSITQLLAVTTGVAAGIARDSGSVYGFKTLSDCINKDNLQVLEGFLTNNKTPCDVDNADEDTGLTLLMLASAQGKLDFVRLLIHHGASLLIKDDDGATALHHAAMNGYSDICQELLEAKAHIEAADSGGWTPLIWAAYRGHSGTVDCLVSHRANVDAKGQYQCSSLLWASGKGYYEIAKMLLDKKANVDACDRHGTTPLIWAARNGRESIASLLINSGANVDAIGMYSWTPLIVATSSNQYNIVEKILTKHPNVNRVDKNGLTPLSIASKEGFSEIALKLLKAGAHTNIKDKSGDTCLIYASRGGHKTIVSALLKKYAADIDHQGKDGRTCLIGAIDRNHVDIVKILLTANPDLEIRCNEGDTALLHAARVWNPDIVQLLLDKKAKPYATNKDKDTALHIAMRAKSKAVVEVFLRNPKNSQFLYRPNNKGETPYNLDKEKGKPILGELYGTRRLNTNEDSEDMYGYDLYSSSLANILTEPSLKMPITVGLYAKWGSGKSFLLGKLQEDMKNFTRDWIIEPTFENSLLLFMVVLHFAFILGIGVWILTYALNSDNIQLEWEIELAIIAAIGTGGLILALTYSFFFGVWKFTPTTESSSLHKLKDLLSKQFSSLKLIMNVLFHHPPGPESVQAGGAANSYETNNAYPLSLLFTEQTKVITSAGGGGQNSVTHMIGSLYDAIEDHYGVIATRLYRAFQPKPFDSTSNSVLRKICCIPYVVIYLMVTLLTKVSIVLLTYALTLEHPLEDDDTDQRPIIAFSNNNSTITSSDTIVSRDNLLFAFYTMALIVAIMLIANIQSVYHLIKSLVFSHRRHLQSAVSKLDLVQSEGYLQAVKSEVQLIVNMSKTLDAFTGCQTRLVVVVDGLDSCEQGRVLSVLDSVHMLFSDEGSPFIILLAIDPHVIIKAIELNIHQTFHDTSIGGDSYLRNIVHLPFYLQNAGFRKVPIAQQLASTANHHGHSAYRNKAWIEMDDNQSQLHRQPSIASGTIRFKKRRETNRLTSRRNSFGSVSSIGSKFKHQIADTHYATSHVGGTMDITKMIATDDYMSDVNVRSMRRLMNVVYVMSRLLRAFHIDFNYSHLATWVHITEQWPYRISWIIFYIEMAAEQHLSNEELVGNSKSLYEIYTRLKKSTAKHINDLDFDRDEKKLEAILKSKQHVMTIKELKIFIPFSINLDPYLQKVIRDEYVKADLSWFKTDAANKKEKKIKKQKVENQDKAFLSLIPLPSESLVDMCLRKKGIEEICTLLRQVKGIKTNCIDSYCDAIISHNISGSVLARCNLQDLKNVLNMNFGDWEIFQWTLDCLRKLEKQQIESGSRTKQWKITGQASEMDDGTKEELEEDDKYIDKAIHMDEALISGLLSTLNEDAHEDVVNEEEFEEELRERQISESASIDENAVESDVIYFTKAGVSDRAMAISVGNEDVFNALEKGTDEHQIQLHQQDFKYHSEELPPTVERLGEKMRVFKKGIRHALHKMDQPNTLPPVHRAQGEGQSSARRPSSSRSSSPEQETV